MDVERTIEFLLSQQVRFDERQARFEEWQVRAQTHFDRLTAQQEQTSREVQTIAGAVHVLIRSVDEDRAAWRELREDLVQVTGNMNALVKVVRRPRAARQRPAALLTIEREESAIARKVFTKFNLTPPPLRDPRVEPTNNRAERALRPAVIRRKVSHCSKTEPGARTFEAFLSVIQTSKQRSSVSVSQALCSLFTAAGRAPPS